MRVKYDEASTLIQDLIGSESIFKLYIHDLLDALISDRILYAELRLKLFDKYIRTDDGCGKLFANNILNIISEEVRKFNRSLTQSEQEDAVPFGLKIIYCASRSMPKIAMKKVVQHCIDLKLSFPDLICGTL